MLLYKFNYYGTTREHYGGYSSSSGSTPPPAADYSPFIDNNTFYLEYQGYKLYNSAILEYGGSFYTLVIFPASCYVYIYNNGNFSQAQQYNNGADNAYTKSLQRETVGGVEIVRNELWSGQSIIETNLPIFTDPQSFMDYITSPVVLHTWQSLEYIAGKSGYYALARLYDFTDGQPVTGATSQDFITLPDDAIINNWVEKIYGYEQIAMYTGDTHYLTVTWHNATSFTMKYYLTEDTLPICSYTYTLSNASDYAYMMLLYESVTVEEQTSFYIRPSVIIQDAVTGLFSYNQENPSEVETIALYNWYVLNYEGSIFGPPTEPEGGDGGGVLQDDPIPEPTAPTVTALDTGFTRMYWVDNTQLKALASWIINSGGSIVTYLFGGDLMQALIGVALSPVNVPHASGATNIKILGHDTQCAGHVLTDQFFTVDCGTYHFDETMGGTYLDYNPYTMIRLILPFIGSMTLETDDVMGKTIHLKYVFDAMSGICVAHVYVNDGKGDSLHYEASGQYLMNVPITKTDYTQDQAAVRNGMLSLAAGAVGVATGGAAALAGIGAIGASALNVMTSHKHINYTSGGGGGVAAYMGVDRPFIIIERPVTARPANDELYTGMPSYITSKIKNFHHYTKFKSVHLEGFEATSEEKADIENALLNGAFIESGSSAPEITLTDPNDTAIVFLKMTSENNTIGKTFGNALQLEGKLIYNQSILTPSIVIDGDAIGYNYAYIPAFNRYYYITNNVVKNGTMQEISMQCDALQSYASAIKECYGIGARSGNMTNYYVNDDAITVKQGKSIITKQFTAPDNTKFSFKKGDAGFVIIVALDD